MIWAWVMKGWECSRSQKTESVMFVLGCFSISLQMLGPIQSSALWPDSHRDKYCAWKIQDSSDPAACFPVFGMDGTLGNKKTLDIVGFSTI